jgi:hypothetical protein
MSDWRWVGLTLPDWGILVATLLLDLSFVLPWLLFLGFTIRPADLLITWALVGLLVGIVAAAVGAGRWPYTRWLALVPLLGGCLLLGILAGVAAAALTIAPVLDSLPLAEANEVVQTLSRLAALVRLPTGDLDRLRDLTARLSTEPRIAFQSGFWLFGVGALGLIVAGYQKLAAVFASPARSDADTRLLAAPND